MNSDFKDLITSLNQFGVRYLIVGGYAVMVYAEPRFTKDLDVFLAADAENLRKFRESMREFGFPLSDEAGDEMTKPNRMISIGRHPFRIDLLNELTGMEFEVAWEGRKVVEIDGVPVNFIGLENLIQTKRATGRPQDLIDVAELEKALKQ